jgi:SAM-dependent methyltransferase
MAWIAWVRRPSHDTYDRFHRDQFVNLLPGPGKPTVDVGCGVARDLLARGHSVVAFDGSLALVAAARNFMSSVAAEVADAGALPLPDACADLVVAFMTLHDVADLEGAVAEVARVLEPGGRFSLAIVHPMNSAGRFQGKGRMLRSASTGATSLARGPTRLICFTTASRTSFSTAQADECVQTRALPIFVLGFIEYRSLSLVHAHDCPAPGNGSQGTEESPEEVNHRIGDLALLYSLGNSPTQEPCVLPPVMGLLGARRHQRRVGVRRVALKRRRDGGEGSGGIGLAAAVGLTRTEHSATRIRRTRTT